jgi:hypothetical protein
MRKHNFDYVNHVPWRQYRPWHRDGHRFRAASSSSFPAAASDDAARAEIGNALKFFPQQRMASTT